MISTDPCSLVLGTAQLGLNYGIANKTRQPSQNTANDIIREAWENGIREFDTAQGYGKSEQVLGKALSQLGLNNEALVISKFHPSLDHLNAGVLSKALDNSLKQLGIPSLYSIMLHREELLSLWDNGLSKTLHGFVVSGKVKQIGISVYSPEKAIQALNTRGIDMVQLPTNILDRRFERSGIFELADKKKKKIYIRSIFLQGLLLMDIERIPMNMAFIKPVLEQFKLLSSDSGLTRKEIALGYLKSEMPDASVVFGAETKDQVKENILIWSKQVPKSLGDKVREVFSNVREEILNPTLWQ